MSTRPESPADATCLTVACSLHDYRALFNHFAGVTFPVSTLSPDAGAELVAYAWIFPNVVPMGHWWYSNIPPYIAADLAARLQAVPKTKQVGLLLRRLQAGVRPAEVQYVPPSSGRDAGDPSGARNRLESQRRGGVGSTCASGESTTDLPKTGRDGRNRSRRRFDRRPAAMNDSRRGERSPTPRQYGGPASLAAPRASAPPRPWPTQDTHP